MTDNTKEIRALLRLVDDPDDEVYDQVVNRLLHYGKEIIPNLESVWEATADEQLQERLELLIHRVHFNDLQQELMEWNDTEEPDLLRGAILIAKFRFPDLNVAAIQTQFEHIRRNVWLELNNYLTSLEQVNVVNSILYNYYKLQGHELTERESKYFFINQVMDSKHGNAYSIGIIYLAVCQVLDIPVYAVDIPRQFIFAYIDTLHSFLNDKESIQQIQFYVDPISGMIYTQKDLDLYLRKINATERDRYFEPMTSRRVICKMLEELSLCYQYRKEDQNAEEILQLIKLISDREEDLF